MNYILTIILSFLLVYLAIALFAGHILGSNWTSENVYWFVFFGCVASLIFCELIGKEKNED